MWLNVVLEMLLTDSMNIYSYCSVDPWYSVLTWLPCAGCDSSRGITVSANERLWLHLEELYSHHLVLEVCEDHCPVNSQQRYYLSKPLRPLSQTIKDHLKYYMPNDLNLQLKHNSTKQTTLSGSFFYKIFSKNENSGKWNILTEASKIETKKMNKKKKDTDNFLLRLHRHL